MNKTLVILVVGLSRDMVSGALSRHAPNLARLAQQGGVRDLQPSFPAVTCSAQSCMLTGQSVSGHGVVANGWYEREQDEIRFWKQSNRLVQGEKLWQRLKRIDASFRCANLFWWFNMATDVDVSVTPRPMYPADGRKIPDIHANPPVWRERLQAQLGQFPLFQFWGPMAGIASSDWIARSASMTLSEFDPTLSLVYLPHLDYPLQRLGPDSPQIGMELAAVDALVGDLISEAERYDRQVIVVSEYSVEAVDGAVALNRVLREHGWLVVRDELGHELLDTGLSQAFAVVDHQIAHVYVREPALIADVHRALASVPGVDSVWDRAAQAELGLAHARSGDLICVAARNRWFSYYYWLDDARAADFARTVDIHRKPGYDPVELFLDPAIRFPKLALGWRLAKKRLGCRTLMDVIPLDSDLVRGSHGRVDAADPPVVLGLGDGLGETAPPLPMTALFDEIGRAVSPDW